MFYINILMYRREKPGILQNYFPLHRCHIWVSVYFTIEVTDWGAESKAVCRERQ